MIDRILDQLKVSYKKNEVMCAHTSFRIGGAAEYFVEPENTEQLAAVINTAQENDINTTVVGNGSNLLVSDYGIDGIVISTLQMKDIKLVDETHIYAAAGASLTAVCVFAKNNRLSGLEFAYGIPGSVGGALYMNAGAYGGEMSQVVEFAESLKDNTVIKRDNAELALSYRHSVYTDTDEIITGVMFALSKGDKDQISERMDTLMQKRKTSQPLDFPSAGSTFKRPEGYFAAALIDECGLKGYSVGDAEVSRKHAGFVINKNKATCKDVLRLIEGIKKTVYEQKGIKLETEVIHIGK